MGNEHSQKADLPGLEQTKSEPVSITSRRVTRLQKELFSKSENGDATTPPTPISRSPENDFELTFSPSTSQSNMNCRSFQRTQRRKSSLLVVNNGITNKYISSRICKISMRFWSENIDCLSHAKQLEISCSIFFTMMASNQAMKQVMKANRTENQKIEETALRYLNMFGWLIRNLVADGIDLQVSLAKLGSMHQNMGVKIEHFNPMLQAMHETFSYYFGHNYTIEVKYAFDEIFAVAAQIMTGQELKFSAHLLTLSEQFQGDDVPFLKNLDVCLSSEIGREYLFRYLAQTWCDEMVIFLQTLSRFKALPSEKERFMVAREIVKTCIRPSATFALNISYENRTNTLYAMKALEQTFTAKEPLSVPVTLFANVEAEVNKLLLDNHWVKFVDGIQVLQSKSFD